MSAGQQVLVDTSIWADHLDRTDSVMNDLLDRSQVWIHPFVIGELAMGNLRRRDEVLRELQKLPEVTSARHDEVMRLIQANRLFGSGIGYIDAHLLAAVALTDGARLWTRDRRLRETAETMGLDFKPRRPM